MQVQCDVCQASLEMPAASTGKSQLQCTCGALVAQTATSFPRNSDQQVKNGQSAPSAKPLAFRIVGESQPVTAPEETEPRSSTPTLRIASASEELGGGMAVAEAVAEVVPAARPSHSAARNKAAVATITPAAAPPPQTGKRRPGAWRQCLEHPHAKAETMCPTCAIGYCQECKKSICSTCDSPCIPTSGYQKWLDEQRMRSRPMMDEIKTILAYPLQDPMAFIIFAMITGFFGFAALFSPRAIIFSWGILLWYSFHTPYQVASGNLTRFIPEFNDISDITHPLRLSGAALLITWGPLLLLGVLFTANVGWGMNFSSIMGGAPTVEEETVASPSPEEDRLSEEVQSLLGDIEGEIADSEESAESNKPEKPAPRHTPEPTTTAAAAATAGETTTGVSVLLLLALLWKVAYTPVALIVAALSKNVTSVLNPLIGVDTIRRMGPVYWHVLLIYTGLTVTE
ncbi:MAG: hypothetical protein FJ147_25350 [Deltaproteobacteria bacterium]|nr:hypothetical protein [Deltaproteobacteria bacterium]